MLLSSLLRFFFFFVKSQYPGLFTSVSSMALWMLWWPCQGHSGTELLLLAVSTVDEPIGLLDGRLVHEHGVLGVAGLQHVVLLVLVSCQGTRQGHT